MNRDAAIVNPQLWNLYAYCQNNPVTKMDPDGRDAREWIVSTYREIISSLGFSYTASAVYMDGRFSAASPGPDKILEKAARILAIGETVIKLGGKIQNQMPKRGWTDDKIKETIQNPERVEAGQDTRHRPDGSRENSPATVYHSKDGGYVVVNNETGDVVQVSDRNKPDWKTPAVAPSGTEPEQK